MKTCFAIALCAVLWVAPGASAQETAAAPAPARPSRETVRVKLPSGSAKVDLYWPAASGPAPLVIVAHGFSRDRHHMAGWGEHLAQAGLAVAVPDLPAWSDHARNARFLTGLREHLCSAQVWTERIDPSRVALMGFSAGGLSSLLAAAETPGLSAWVGLDPVDMKGMGAKAAAQVRCRAVVLTADPSSCNADGNARAILEALPACEHFKVVGATHVDAEWPTSGLAELLCGRSTEPKRREFRERATAALVEQLLEPPTTDRRPPTR